MSDIDAVAGMYNIVDRRRRETADYQVPVGEFIAKLENHDLPQEICVVGLGDVLSGDEELRESLVDTMRQEMDYLNGQRPLPTVQFAVDGEFQNVGDSFDVEINGEFHALESVFGRQMKQREPGWLVTTFRV
ncbi:hypothetical protein [Halobellus marinus]|uniref:hypothetical protein n=1 Tax=Halobellus TaxID=1073986 RepID=UPI0028AE234B|nr:hypothetical protein [Halobellus sp. DFY28]